MKKLLYFLALSLCIVSCTKGRHDGNYVVVVSLDAFRWDYPKIHGTPSLDLIAEEGVDAVMMPSYPASTFPNHYTIATGLVPDHHGIVNSQFWDEATGVEYSMGEINSRNDAQYYSGEPIWTTAEKQGLKTASIYWVGSDIPIGGSLPTYYRYWYDEPRLTYPERVDETLRLLRLPKRNRPRLIMTYFDEPDMAGHHSGPESEGCREMVQYMDSLMGVLYSGIKKLPYAGKVNLIVTSDHGMTDISADRVVAIGDYLKPEWYNHIESTTPTNIYSKPEFHDTILKALEGIEHISVWEKGNVPAELVYGTNSHEGDIIVSPDLGWQFTFEDRGIPGAHGYSPLEPDMQVMFRACGPDFKENFVAEDKFVNVDIYPLIAKILKIEPKETDGKIERVQGLLRYD
ncbi:MAG: ectonucleotide pyrophosphatase/phosphodiesterase [Bacteroidales bacterium]|nr:ectonucleotide pyrophosphatase/phosphodiesterase [Bacteroidales bacterium]